MKCLKNPKTTISTDGKKATVEFDIVDQNFSQIFIQRVTIGHLNPKNLGHPRQVQISNEAVFVKSFGVGLAFPLDDVIQIAAVVEPKTTFAPVFKKTGNPLTVEISSELDPDFQWQVTDRIKPKPVEHGKGTLEKVEWSNIEGQTSMTLDPSKVKKGQWVRCVASSEAGEMASNPFEIK